MRLEPAGVRRMNSSSFEQGQIIVAPIPFAGNASSKIRPALVVSRRSYNAASEDIVVLKVTTKVKDYPFDVLLMQSDLKLGSLKEESVIQADFPVVIEKLCILKIIGEISGGKLSEVKKKIRELYGL